MGQFRLKCLKYSAASTACIHSIYIAVSHIVSIAKAIELECANVNQCEPRLAYLSFASSFWTFASLRA